MRRTITLALASVLTIILIGLTYRPSAAQEKAIAATAALPTQTQTPPPPPPASLAKTEAEMKPYKITIPGSNVSFEMVPIKGGTFVMGSPSGEADRDDNEGPRAKVRVAPFWMGKFEVTWDEYDLYAFPFGEIRKQETEKLAQLRAEGKISDAVSRPTPPYADPTFGLGRKGQPVICVSHHAAMEYCRWLSGLTGQTYRLATEAEWEYAARAGSATPYSFGDDPSLLPEYAWFVENAERPQKVGLKKSNPWGLFDMHGNVAEWCLDHYDPDQYAKYPQDRAIDRPVLMPDANPYSYTVRGGSWDDDPDKLRSAARRGSEREWSMQDPQRPQSIWWHTDATFVGFRIVRALDEQPELVGLRSKVVKPKGAK